MGIEVIDMTNRHEVNTNRDVENRVVVGVDGSDGADQALDFAMHDARRRGAILQVISAFGLPPVAEMATLAMDPFEDASRQILNSALARVAEIEPSIVAKGESHFGNPEHILVEESKGAALLVVGSRGRGEFTSFVLGSVSEGCVHHATCPITVVH
jgi:nucleotide-binding universal stress UspA family protein